MKATTLNRIRAHGPRDTGWKQLLRHLGKTHADDEPLSFATILASNGLDDALWCLRAEPQFAADWRLMACAFAREVAYLNTDPRVMNCIEVAERFARGEASEKELKDAWRVAHTAANATTFPAYFAWTAVEATTAADAAYAAAYVARADDAAAAYVARADDAAACAAAAVIAAKEKQKEIFMRFAA